MAILNEVEFVTVPFSMPSVLLHPTTTLMGLVQVYSDPGFAGFSPAISDGAAININRYRRLFIPEPVFYGVDNGNATYTIREMITADDRYAWTRIAVRMTLMNLDANGLKDQGSDGFILLRFSCRARIEEFLSGQLFMNTLAHFRETEDPVRLCIVQTSFLR
jgi:hypothetical protein